MKKKLVVACALGLVGACGIGLANNSNSVRTLAASNKNFITNGDLSFYKGNDIRLPKSGEGTINGVYSYTVDGNSVGHVVKENDNMVGKLLWDGETTSTNADIWLCTSNLGKKGAGKYVFEGDFKCSAFTTSDFFGLALSGIKKDGSVFWKEIIVCISADEFKSSDHPESEVLGEYGYKHFTRTATLSEEEAECWDTLQCNLFIHDSQKQVVRIDNMSVKKEGDNEELLMRDGKYIGDFEQFAPNAENDGRVLTNDKFYGYYLRENISASPATLGVYDGVSALRLQYDGSHSYARADKEITLEQAGNYSVEFDFKLSPNADPYEFTARIMGPEISYTSCYLLYAATCIEDLEFLEPSETLQGYYHFSGTAWIDNLTAKSCECLEIAYDTSGKTNNYVDVTNLSIKLKEAIEYKTSPKAADGLVFKDIVQMGDFEKMPVGTTFVAEPTEATAFWGSNALDDPGVIRQDDKGNRYLHIEPSTKTYGSAFVFLDPAEYSNSEVFRLEFDAKCVTGSNVKNPTAAQFTFVGGTGKENFMIHLNDDDSVFDFHAEGNTYTNGVNTSIYPYTVTALENGWLHYEMNFKMNSQFMTTVDSMRFLAGPGFTLDVDNVRFGAYRSEGGGEGGDSSSETNPTSSSENNPSGNNEQKKEGGCGGSIAASCGLISVISLLAIAFSKRKGE